MYNLDGSKSMLDHATHRDIDSKPEHAFMNMLKARHGFRLK
jgi:hypothetical protein